VVHYAPGTRRVVVPGTRTHRIGYRAGGPTPNPQPGPAPVVPAGPPLPSLRNPLPSLPSPVEALSGTLTAAVGIWTSSALSAGQVALGAALVGVGLLLLLGMTGAGGTAARGARTGVRRAARALPVVGAVA
jgi:hypothetical protein